MGFFDAKAGDYPNGFPQRKNPQLWLWVFSTPRPGITPTVFLKEKASSFGCGFFNAKGGDYPNGFPQRKNPQLWLWVFSTLGMGIAPMVFLKEKPAASVVGFSTPRVGITPAASVQFLPVCKNAHVFKKECAKWPLPRCGPPGTIQTEIKKTGGIRNGNRNL